MAFENVGPQWDRDEPWQTQQAKVTIRGLTDSSPWMRHQRHLLVGGLVALAALVVVVTTLISVTG